MGVWFLGTLQADERLTKIKISKVISDTPP
jgi:hypothetical protein